MTAVTRWSQNAEQDYVLAACRDLAGRFLEIGAWNAFDKSNVRALYEQGWSGVLVEPSPVPFAGLKAEYADDDRVKLIAAAVVTDPNLIQVEMYVTADAVSTTEEAHFQKWREYAAFDRKKLRVPAITLERIFDEHGDFDMISIDTEGTSVDLLHRVLELGKRPKCIVVEHDDRVTEAKGAAEDCGYSCVYENGENLVLVRG